MKAIFIFLRVVGFLFFVLIAIGYYMKGFYIHGLYSAILGGMAASPAKKYPFGARVKVIALAIGVALLIAVHPASLSGL